MVIVIVLVIVLVIAIFIAVFLAIAAMSSLPRYPFPMAYSRRIWFAMVNLKRMGRDILSACTSGAVEAG